MAYSLVETRTQDIDWFISDGNNRPIHVASAGGILPSLILNRNITNEYNRECVNQLPYLYNNIFINPNLEEIIAPYYHADNIMQENYMENYLHSFMHFAKKGFFSFDKTKINDPDDTTYHLVAYPINSDFNIQLEKLQLNCSIPIICEPFDLFQFFEEERRE